MKPKSEFRKRLFAMVIVTKKIISVFKKLKYIEKEGTIDTEFFKKHLELLEELIVHEKSLCEKLIKDEQYNEIVKSIINNPAQFQIGHGIKGQAFSRFFRNLLLCEYNKQNEIELNILSVIPEFSQFDFKMTNQNYPQLFKAFSEDLFHSYIKLIERNIQKQEHKKIKNELIDEKYDIFIIYANTNQFFIQNARNSNNLIESKAASVLEEAGLDNRVYDFLLTDFAYNFCDDFFDNMLVIEDKGAGTNQKEKILRFVLLESILSLLPVNVTENLENLFYRKYYEMNTEYDYSNKNISEEVLNIFQKLKKKPKTLIV